MDTAQHRHIIISGIGRSGTTFLVKILTELGLDTGFMPGDYPIFENCNAGLEIPLNRESAPYIVKDPRICDYLPEIIRMGKIVEHALIPVRKLEHATLSRILVQNKIPALRESRTVPGGLWDTGSEQEQQKVLAEKFYKLVQNLTKYEIPATFLDFPRFATDAEYLYNKIKPIFDIDYRNFLEAFYRVSDPQSIHDFEKIHAENLDS